MNCLPSDSRAAQREVPLAGGTTNAGRVFRVGDTVRRPAQATTGTHALLAHLESVGFDGAPRYLGVDGQGRDVLSYLPGEAVVAPYPAWAMTDAALVSVAQLLARYHRAVEGFDARGLSWAKPLPTGFRGTMITHNDPNLDNVVFRDGLAVGLIDFDLAAPGTAVWDVAAATRLWCPLREERDVDEARRGRSLHRLRLFADAYGLDDEQRAALPAAVEGNHLWCYDIVEAAVHQGHPAFTATWSSGASARYQRTTAYYARSASALRAVLS